MTFATLHDARTTMAETYGQARATDSPFFTKVHAKVEKLEGRNAHPADWRRLRAEIVAWLEPHAAKPGFSAQDKAAFDHAEALIAICDRKIDVAAIAHGDMSKVTRNRGQELIAAQPRAGDSWTNAFAQFLRNPRSSIARGNLQMEENDQIQLGRIRAEGSTLSGAAGGFAVPAPVHDEIGVRIREISPMRQLATQYDVMSTATAFLVNRNNAASAWVGETDERTGTAEPTLDKRTPTYGTVYGRIEATEELMLDSAVNLVQWFTDAAVQSIAQAEGAAFVSGNGTDKPTGFLAGPTPVATGDATRASGTLQFVSPSQVGAITPESLFALFFATKAVHRAAGSWLMSSATASIVSSMRDGDGRFLWSQSLADGVPSTLMGRPVFYSEDMPAIEPGAFPIAFGNFRAGYLIADSGDLRITVDDNVTRPGYVRWYVRRRVGGVIYDSEAIKLLKILVA